MLGDQVADLLGHALGVEEEDPPLRPRDQQAGEGLVVGVLGRERTQDVGAALPADRVHLRADDLARQPDQRDQDRDQDALERADDEHAQTGDRRPAKLHGAHPPDGEELRGRDQRQAGDDDHHGERRVGQAGEDRGEEEHGERRDRGGHHRGGLRAAPRGVHQRRLRRAAAGRQGAEEGAAEARGAGGDELAVGADRRVVGPVEGARGGDRLGEAHQGDAERARQQLQREAGIGQQQLRESLRDLADRRQAARLEAEPPGRRDAAGDRDERGRRTGPEMLHAEERHQGDDGEDERERRGLRQVPDEAPESRNQPTLS